MNPNLLRECAQHLIETPKFIQGGEVSGGSTSPSSASSHTSTTSSTRYNNSIQSGSAVPNKAPSVSESARQEHNWIFEYRTPGSSRQSRSSRQSLNSGRRTHANGRQAANASWSCSFICLASADQCCPPSTIERIEVYIEWAGGEKKNIPKRRKC